MTTDLDVIRLVELFLRSPYYRKVPLIGNRFNDWSPSSTYPAAMIRGHPDAEGCVEWQPVDSPLDQEFVDGFERYLEVRLPSAFKPYLMYKCLLDTDLRVAILPGLDPRRPFGWLEWCVKESRRPVIRARPWYVPFTDSRAQMGVLCFDTRRPDPAGDYPIMLAIDNSPSLDSPRPEYAEFHPSFRSYIRHICDYLEYVIGGRDRVETFVHWLTEQGRPVPAEVLYNPQ